MSADLTWIVDGTPEANQPAVVAIVAQLPLCGSDDIVFCTGTLVAPRAVLTAKHCIGFAPPGGMVVVGGPDARDSAASHLPVVAVYEAEADDVAILALASPFPATPATLRTTALDDTLLGTSVRIVGYGVDDFGVVGVKRSGDATIDQVAPRRFRIVPGPALSCNGDSGGPVFVGTELAGVTSFGDPECVFSGTNVRVDVLVDAFIAPALAAIAALPEGDGTPLAPGEDLCARVCEQDFDCPPNFTCVESADGSSRGCGYLGMPPGRMIAACEVTDADTGAAAGCDGTCVVDPAGLGCRCYEECPGPDTGGCGGCASGGAPSQGRPAGPSLLLFAAAAALFALRSPRRSR